jgi:hypothetical protein
MKLAGNLNAAILSGQLARMNRALDALCAPMQTKATKEAALAALRDEAADLGIYVPPYNGPAFSRWVQVHKTICHPAYVRAARQAGVR